MEYFKDLLNEPYKTANGIAFYQLYRFIIEVAYPAAVRVTHQEEVGGEYIHEGDFRGDEGYINKYPRLKEYYDAHPVNAPFPRSKEEEKAANPPESSAAAPPPIPAGGAGGPRLRLPSAIPVPITELGEQYDKSIINYMAHINAHYYEPIYKTMRTQPPDHPAKYYPIYPRLLNYLVKTDNGTNLKLTNDNVKFYQNIATFIEKVYNQTYNMPNFMSDDDLSYYMTAVAPSSPAANVNDSHMGYTGGRRRRTHKKRSTKRRRTHSKKRRGNRRTHKRRN